MGDYAKTSDLSGYATTEALTSLTNRVSNNETSISANAGAIATNTANIATNTTNISATADDVDNIANILSATTDTGMTSSPKFNTVMANHNIAVGIYEGDDIPKTNP